MTEFGHIAWSSGNTMLDVWGVGPFTLRVGKRRYYFTDCDRFGPLLENKRGVVLDRQPITEKHPFWRAYQSWRESGRKCRTVGNWSVCCWN